MTKKRGHVLTDPNLPFLLNTYVRLCEIADAIGMPTTVVVIVPDELPQFTCGHCSTVCPVDEMCFLPRCLNCNRCTLVVEPGGNNKPTTVQQKGG